jgi:carotenoid 1,2-hydratase
MPWMRRMRGTVRLEPDALLEGSYALDAAGRHLWCPIAPCARVHVALENPALSWSGTAYLDCNRGERPLEQDFHRWDWSRTALADRRSAVPYEVRRSDGSDMSLALAFNAQGGVKSFEPPPVQSLPDSGWRVPRTTRSEVASTTRVSQSLEDGPFYARSVLEHRLMGESATAVPESLCMQRWVQPVVQLMLPFRMPRRV